MKWKLLILVVLLLVSSLLLFLFLTRGTDELTFRSGTHPNIWEEPWGAYEPPAVPDQETALAIAKAIFNGMKKSNEAKTYVPSSVFYDEADEVWIVSFDTMSSQLPNGAYVTGGGLSIAIQKSDGQILGIWGGE